MIVTFGYWWIPERASDCRMAPFLHSHDITKRQTTVGVPRELPTTKCMGRIQRFGFLKRVSWAYTLL